MFGEHQLDAVDDEEEEVQNGRRKRGVRGGWEEREPG